MDGLTHSLVGLAAAKAGLDRLSPGATAVCMLAANAPDSDAIILLTSDRWTFLQHHRGITHSIVGVITLAILLPTIFFGVDWLLAKVRRRHPRIRYRGLLLASLVTTVTHPIMDWTNNYGVRPLLPWSGKWFYGDLVFIVDPYILLFAGGAAFLLTSNRWSKIVLWAVLGALVTVVIFLFPIQRAGDGPGLMAARVVWSAGLLSLILARIFRNQPGRGNRMALAGLALVVLYWLGLAGMHALAYRNTVTVASNLAMQRGEQVVQSAAMPTPGNPLRWLAVAETDRASYRFYITAGSKEPAAVERFEKSSGAQQQDVLRAAGTREAQILLGFARFPVARVEDESCLRQTLVQFADLRYTEPGSKRGTFALEVPLECPARVNQ